MNTPILQSFPLSVGQLAKTPFFQLHPSKDNTLRVGRHIAKTPHTSALTHKHTPAPDFNAQKLVELSDFALKQHLNDLLADQLPDLNFFVHNSNYLADIEAKYSLTESKLFVLLLRLFAFQNTSYQTHQERKFIKTNDTNFLQAYQVLKQRQLNRYNQLIKPNQLQKVLKVIHTHFWERTFEETDICKHLYLTYQQIETILQFLVLKKNIESITGKLGVKFYRLSTNSFSHVIGE